MIVLVALVGPNVFNVILVIGVLGWPGLARLIRGQVLSLRETDYVTAARATGASDARISAGAHLAGRAAVRHGGQHAASWPAPF